MLTGFCKKLFLDEFLRGTGIVGNQLNMAVSGILLPRKTYGIPNGLTYQVIS
jgi:hypothetical protein